MALTSASWEHKGSATGFDELGWATQISVVVVAIE
jgi:hypothetical protein